MKDTSSRNDYEGTWVDMTAQATASVLPSGAMAGQWHTYQTLAELQAAQTPDNDFALVLADSSRGCAWAAPGSRSTLCGSRRPAYTGTVDPDATRPTAPAGGFTDSDQYIRTDNGQIWEFAGGQWRRMTVLVAGGQVQAVYKVARNIPARTLRLTPGDGPDRP